MKKDINLISFNGPQDNGQSVDLTPDGPIVPGPEISDTLKFSTGLTNFYGRFPSVTSGMEDCIDVNNQCDLVNITVDELVFHGTMGVTIKGGSTNIRVTAHNCKGHGKETDVDIGNWYDQSSEPTTGVMLDISRSDGEPVYVRVINGDTPMLMPDSGPYKFIFPWPWIPRGIVVPIFNLLHKLNLI
jgi:hypothetical protein